jgi:hypothetical protein
MDVKKPQLVLHFRQRADNFYRAVKDDTTEERGNA